MSKQDLDEQLDREAHVFVERWAAREAAKEAALNARAERHARNVEVAALALAALTLALAALTLGLWVMAGGGK